MAVKEKLLQFKFHLIFVTLLALALAILLSYSPRALTIVSYFWPLLLSTALFLIAIVVFGQISPPESEATVEKTSTVLIDYVAGHPDAKSDDTHLLLSNSFDKAGEVLVDSDADSPDDISDATFLLHSNSVEKAGEVLVDSVADSPDATSNDTHHHNSISQ